MSLTLSIIRQNGIGAQSDLFCLIAVDNDSIFMKAAKKEIVLWHSFSLKKCQWCLRKRYCIFHSSDNIVSTNNVQSTILIQMIGPNKREWCSSHCCCQRHTIVHTNKTSPQYETIPIHITQYWYVCHKKGTSFLQQAILQISRRMLKFLSGKLKQ